MQLLSPQKIELKPRQVVATSSHDVSYIDTTTEMQCHTTISVLFFGDKDWPVGGTTSVDVKVEIPDIYRINSFVVLQRQINVCINNAENIKNRLLNTNQFILRNSKKKEEINILDLMKLKDNFCDFIKNNPTVRHIANKEKRRMLNQFILDRNIYTHGILKIRSSDNAFILEHLDNHTKQKSYSIINTEILKSYSQAYLEIVNMISEFHSLIKN
ncbi:hypothetical protein [Hymenobacter sp. CRA2]|uniref:hypothetical protein n=1 Tax=Hymenobacter sp. CRA2 TaxID=1955620 RepID=UPI0011167B33|nr:hypothetical protein [Hymenobacter sp. CRA2]